MKIIDVVFALVSGYAIGWLARDFLQGYGVEINFWHSLILHYATPAFSLFCLWVADLIGRKLLFVFQIAKHLLVGAFVTVIDLKLFEFLVWVSLLFFSAPPVISKGVSFLAATSIKYWGNKRWAFEKHEKEELSKEIFRFSTVTVVGLGIDVGAFYYFIKILGPQFLAPEQVWVKLSVILAAIVAALWTFSGYKFLVFKK